MTTAEKLRNARGEKSSLEVSDAIGIARSTLQMYEAGLRTPRDEIKIKLADYYKLPIGYLFYDEKCDALKQF